MKAIRGGITTFRTGKVPARDAAFQSASASSPPEKGACRPRDDYDRQSGLAGIVVRQI
jgi:hypothetical protein